MKDWFCSLDESIRKKIVLVSWITTIASFILGGILPSDSAISGFIGFLFLVGIVIGILSTKWNSVATKEQEKANREREKAVKEAERRREEEIKEAERRKQREEMLQKKVAIAQNELQSLPHHTINISNEPRKRRTGYEEISFSNITPKGKYSEFVVFDTETTGLAPSKDRIVELAAIRFVDGVPTEVFDTFINPEKEIPAEASAINHITNEMVANAPTISEVLPSFEAFVGNSPLVAHNLEFDLKFLFYSGSTITDSQRKYFDTLAQSQKILKKIKSKYNREYDMWEEDYDSDWDVENYKLGTLADYFDITFPCQHRASGDAFVTGKLFLELIRKKQSNY